MATTAAFSQVGIGTTTPNSASILDLTSTNKGLLLPRLTTAQRNAIVSPATGLQIYNTTKNCLEWYNGSLWYNGCDNQDPILNCAGATLTGTLTNGFVASGVSSSIPYTGGNGSSHTGQVVTSTGVTGLTATLSAGNFAVGASSLIYNITGTPASSGTASFAISIGGQSCSLSVMVAATCGAYVALGVYKVFMCHNLGANTSLSPNTPLQGIHGNFYQWGRSTVVADASTPAGTIAGWNISDAADGSWSDASKTANDSCPTGYRVPTRTQWLGVIANNTISRTGSWANDGNFTSAIHWGPDANTITLTLPAAGMRTPSEGALQSRGYYGYYWTSTMFGPYAYWVDFGNTAAAPSLNGDVRRTAMSVRCIQL